MIIDEPTDKPIVDAAKRAIWRAAKESRAAEEIFAKALSTNKALRSSLVASVIRGVENEIIWSNASMVSQGRRADKGPARNVT